MDPRRLPGPLSSPALCQDSQLKAVSELTILHPRPLVLSSVCLPSDVHHSLPSLPRLPPTPSMASVPPSLRGSGSGWLSLCVSLCLVVSPTFLSVSLSLTPPKRQSWWILLSLPYLSPGVLLSLCSSPLPLLTLLNPGPWTWTASVFRLHLLLSVSVPGPGCPMDE